jgi:hypothetical protein
MSLVLLSAGCGQEGLIGETDDGVAGGQRGGGTIGLDWSEKDCYQRSELGALPVTEATFPKSPALWVESGRGKWANAAGDTLEVSIDTPATRVEFVCYDDATIAAPPGTKPSVSFMLAGRVTLHSADGAWDETFDASFGLSELSSATFANMVLSARGELDLTTLHGSFALPGDLKKPAQQLVQLSLEYQDAGWILHRSVEVDRSKPGKACGCAADAEPAWAAEQLTFVRL